MCMHLLTVYRNFNCVLDVLAVKTALLTKETLILRATMPMSFWKLFRLYQDFIEHPTDLLFRAQVWSNYKH